jgi:ABC-type branched-subunit amino acid transport system substrate-binding protein
VAACLAAGLAGCPKRTALVNGVEVPVEKAEDAARRELPAVRAEVATLPPAEGAARLEAFAGRFRGTPAAAEALHGAAERWRAAGRLDRSAAALGTLLTEYPLYPRSVEAKYLLAIVNIDSGRARDGLATLGSLYGKLPAEVRPEAAARAAEAAERTGADVEALRWLEELARAGDGRARAEALARAADVVDRLPFLEVARQHDAFDREAAVQEVLTMKLARIHLHLRDHARAEEMAREVFLRWPDGPYAADAKAIVEHIGKLNFVRPNVIGVAVPLTGPQKRLGEMILAGVGLALGEGSPYRLAVRDTRGEPDGADAAIQALALEEGAIVVVGGVTTAEAERAASAAEDLHLPFVSLSRQDGITEAGPHVFQNMLTPSAQARALVDLAMGKRNMKRFALLWPSVPYGVELANAFWDEVEARGGEVRAAETYASDRTTFTPLVQSMVGKLFLDDRSDWQEQVKEIGQKERDPFRRRKAIEKAREKLDPLTDFEAIFIPDGASNVKLIAPALAVEDVIVQTCEPDEVARIRKTTGRTSLQPVQLLGSNGWGFDPSLFDVSPGGAGRHVRCAIYVDGFWAGSARPETRRFVEAFGKKFEGQVPTILEASAYDSARMARQVLEAARPQTRTQFRDGLAAVKDHHGATGDITVGPRRTAEKALFFMTVDRGGLREMKPEELQGAGAGGS